MQNNLDNLRYLKKQDELRRQWEERCMRCGACCGVSDADPCRHLLKRTNEKYKCTIYHQRYGLRASMQGRQFRCVAIRDILHTSWPGQHLCAYKR